MAERPLGITFLVGFMCLAGLAFLAPLLYLVFKTIVGAWMSSGPHGVPIPPVYLLFVFGSYLAPPSALGGGTMIAAWGLWKQRGWARRLTVTMLLLDMAWALVIWKILPARVWHSLSTEILAFTFILVVGGVVALIYLTYLNRAEG